MELTKIDILKYKSIKQPVSILFHKGQVVTLIGKNGSGKTNILEALHYIFDVNSHSKYYNEKIDLKYKVYIKLNEDDLKSILPEVVYNHKESELVAYNDGDELRIDTVESDYLVPLLKQEIMDIKDLASQLKSALEDYVNCVESVVVDDYNANKSLMGFTLHKDHVTNFSVLKHNIEYNVKLIREIVDKLLQSFSDDQNVLHYIANNYIYFYGIEDLKFELKYYEPVLSEFEKKYISINTRAIKASITRINNKTRDSCDKITSLANEIVDRTKKICNALETDEISQRTKAEQYCSFLKKIQNVIGRKSLFLKNDSSELIFVSNDNKHRYYKDNANYILETYLRQVYCGSNKEELLRAISEGKNIELSNDAVSEFEKYLNLNIPKFDRNMFEFVKVEYDKERGLAVKLQEKGELIDLNFTSAGRRWYFTYYFMKNILTNRDVFIIDEPAGMLHPAAQQEVLTELQLLASQGIKVVYSTHSSYLIPDNFKVIHNVEMDIAQGTKVTNYDCTEKLCKDICDELGVQRTSELLFGLSKTTLIVEGSADKTCLLKFFSILKYDKSQYNIFECRGQPILDVAHLCIEWGIKFKALFDRDTLEQSREGYLISHGYQTYLAEIQNNPNCVFTPINGERKSLEDCFSLNDANRYFSSNNKGVNKIDKNKIRNAIDFDEETKNNFEQLFKQLGIPKLD